MVSNLYFCVCHICCNFLKHLIIFNWRISALQYCLGFCHTSVQISHGCTCVPSLFNLPPPTLPPILPLQVISEHQLWAGCVIQHIPADCAVLCMVMYMFQCYSVSSSHPSFPQCPQACVLHVCVSIAALKIGSSVPSFYIPLICINVCYLFFFFWLTSL